MISFGKNVTEESLAKKALKYQGHHSPASPRLSHPEAAQRPQALLCSPPPTGPKPQLPPPHPPRAPDAPATTPLTDAPQPPRGTPSPSPPPPRRRGLHLALPVHDPITPLPRHISTGPPPLSRFLLAPRHPTTPGARATPTPDAPRGRSHDGSRDGPKHGSPQAGTPVTQHHRPGQQRGEHGPRRRSPRSPEPRRRVRSPHRRERHGRPAHEGEQGRPAQGRDGSSGRRGRSDSERQDHRRPGSPGRREERRARRPEEAHRGRDESSRRLSSAAGQARVRRRHQSKGHGRPSQHERAHRREQSPRRHGGHQRRASREPDRRLGQAALAATPSEDPHGAPDTQPEESWPSPPRKRPGPGAASNDTQKAPPGSAPVVSLPRHTPLGAAGTIGYPMRLHEVAPRVIRGSRNGGLPHALELAALHARRRRRRSLSPERAGAETPAPPASPGEPASYMTRPPHRERGALAPRPLAAPARAKPRVTAPGHRGHRGAGPGPYLRACATRAPLCLRRVRAKARVVPFACSRAQ
ncbi:hypothetical protein ACSSS7_007288 [Eimeria intestinalis]